MNCPGACRDSCRDPALAGDLASGGTAGRDWVYALGSLFSIDVSPVANLDNFNDEHIINDLINHSVISDTNSVCPLAPAELGTSLGKRINYKSLNRRNDPLDFVGSNASQVLASGLAPLNLVGGHRLGVELENRYEQSWALYDDLRYQPDLEHLP